MTQRRATGSGGYPARGSGSWRPPPKARGRGARLLLLVGLWGFIIGLGALGYFALTLPDTRDLTAAQRKPSMTLLAADGSLLATYGDLFGEALRLQELPKYVPQAVIATEDRRFYSHFGIDPVG